MDLTRIPLLLAFLVAGPVSFAQTTQTPPAGNREPSAAPRSSTSAPNRDGRNAGRPAGRPQLPDPALLDGSGLEPEKRPEHGMLAEFEMPGSEKKEGDQDKVGGGEGQQQQSGNQQAGGGGSSPANQNLPGGQAVAKNDPNAQAQGIQVAELKVDPDAGAGGPNAAKERPPQVTLGDPAMQIKPVSGATKSEVVGTQQTGTTQQFEKPVASGKQQGDNRNKGVEKGRAMPSGL